ncbi:PF11848 domain protein [Leptospira interrogans str. FPW2026]|nr:PF11848 domain protein [Leptospira interrogans str. FPW2026]
MYETVLITEAVAEEFNEPLPKFVKIRKLSDKINGLVLEQELDKGEATTIALGLEMENPLLILDDFRARIMAARLGISLTGTIGVLAKAKKQGHIQELNPLLAKLKSSGMWISETVIQSVLRDVSE